jgi:hypothetical protein
MHGDAILLALTLGNQSGLTVSVAPASGLPFLGAEPIT